MRFMPRTLLALIVLLPACGAGPVAGDVSGGGAPDDVWWRTDRTLPSEIVLDSETLPVVEYGLVPLEVLWDAADSIFRGDVVAADGPYWNQASGQVWEYDEDNPGFIPTPYREVAITVSEGYRGSYAPGDQLLLFVQGAGASLGGGFWFDGADLEVGDDVVALAKNLPFRMREGEISVLTPIREPISILEPSITPDGTVVFSTQRASGEGWPLLDGKTVADLYPDGIPADRLGELTQAFDDLVTPPEALDLFEFIYFPYDRAGDDS